jgi:hypothetical protein
VPTGILARERWRRRGFGELSRLDSSSDQAESGHSEIEPCDVTLLANPEIIAQNPDGTIEIDDGTRCTLTPCPTTDTDAPTVESQQSARMRPTAGLAT